MMLPDKVKMEVTGNKVKLFGEKGSLEWEFPYKELKIEVKNNEVVITGAKKVMVNTAEAHIKNMSSGVSKGYVRKLQTVYSHFPISLEIKDKKFVIKNFLGEKQSRSAKIVGTTKIEVKGQEVTISGTSKNDVGQTVANIINATRISNRDSRVFQDGLYVVEE